DLSLAAIAYPWQTGCNCNQLVSGPSMKTQNLSYPTLDVNPFTVNSLEDPFPIEDQIRETAPIVWLSDLNVWATGRYDLVQSIFLDHETFISSHGTGLTNTALEKNWRKPSVILEQDPPDHTKTRKVMSS